MRSFTLLLLSLLIPSQAFAKIETPRPIVSEDVHRALARAEQVIELVRATRNVAVADFPGHPSPSDLRVSLVVLNNGTSNELSPTHDLYLAMYNVLPQYGVAWALEPVASVYGFSGVVRTGPGLYRVSGVTYDPESPTECYLANSYIDIDAREMSIAVRNAEGLRQFDTGRYRVYPFITETNLSCVNR